MSTRCNLHIKKGNTTIQLYHHHDGYPEGVGQDLKVYFDEIYNSPDKDKILKTPKSLGKWLSADERDDEWEYEGETDYVHDDIEYLYIIDLDTDTIICKYVWDDADEIIYTVCIWDEWTKAETQIEEYAEKED